MAGDRRGERHREPILLGAPGSPEQVREIARLDAAVLASIGLVSLAFIGLVRLEGVDFPDYHPEVILGFGSAAVLIAFVTRRVLLPARLTRYAYPLAILAVLAGVWAGGPMAGPVVAMFLMWFGGVIIHMTRRATVLIVVFTSVAYGILVAVQRGNPMPFLQWNLVTTLLLTFALTTDRMVKRSWSLAASESAALTEAERTTAELEAVNEQKTKFLARMSHELRTPLNAVIGFSQVLASKAYGPLTPKQAEYSDDIVESGEHLVSLVDELLDVSKVESGGVELSISRIEVADLLSGCAAVVQEQARRQRITLTTDVSPVAGAMHGDARKLRQVVLNLLSNAIKFTPAGGEVTLRASATGGGVAIRVEDTGPGIDPAEQEAIFEEFHQADGMRTTARGTGLGLPLARRFAELHGGRLWVESDGRGAAFTAELPRHAELPTSDAPTAPLRRSGLRAFGEPDSEGRRQESARLAAIVGIGIGLAATLTTVLLMLHPEAAPGARPGWLALESAATFALVAGIALRPQIMAGPRTLMWSALAVTMSLALSSYLLGPYWGQLISPIYAWLVGVAVLAFSARWFVAMLVVAGASQAVSLGFQPDVQAPIARWAASMGFAVATAVVFSRLTVRVQRMADADRDARDAAERIADELRVASRHKSEFLANMSHELRTPLNAVIGFSEVLESEAFGPLNEKQADYVHDVLHSGRHLLALINDILDLAKSEAGHTELRPGPVDVSAVVERAIDGSAVAALDRQLTFETTIGDIGTIDADEPKLRHVVASLLSNAVKFAPQGSTVTVSVRHAGPDVELSVTDTGPGVAPSDRERIFEAFVHGVGSEHRRQGAGVGLALARRYAELHGGTLGVASRKGGGATFTLSIPAHRPARVGAAR